MRKGFTLIELIVVVIIVGILATFAVPQYLKATERAKGAKAKNALSLISQAEKLYRAENDTYIVTGVNNTNVILGSYVELNAVDADTNWQYQVGAATANTFTVTGTRVGGAYAGTLTLNQDGVWSGTGAGATGNWSP